PPNVHNQPILLDEVFAVAADTEAVQLDEAGGVLVVIGGAFLKGGEVGAVQGVLGFAADGPRVALVELQAHGAGNAFLRLVDEGLHGFAFGGIPETVVDGSGVGGHHHVADVHGFAFHRDAFEVLVGHVDDGAAGGLVHAAGLDAHKA